jgi:hypothetical protein
MEKTRILRPRTTEAYVQISRARLRLMEQQGLILPTGCDCLGASSLDECLDGRRMPLRTTMVPPN